MTASHLGYVVATVCLLLTAAVAVADLLRAHFVLANADEVGLSPAALPYLAVLKLAGSIGLLAGLFGLRLIGLAAAVGLVLFFLGAVLAHLRARVFHNVAFPVAYLALAAGTLAHFT